MSHAVEFRVLAFPWADSKQIKRSWLQWTQSRLFPCLACYTREGAILTSSRDGASLASSRDRLVSCIEQGVVFFLKMTNGTPPTPSSLPWRPQQSKQTRTHYASRKTHLMKNYRVALAVLATKEEILLWNCTHFSKQNCLVKNIVRPTVILNFEICSSVATWAWITEAIFSKVTNAF